jgi:predicted transcriptional regulator
VLSSSDLIELTRELDEDLTSFSAATVDSHHWLLEKVCNGIGNDKVSAHMTENVALVDARSSLPHVAGEMLRNRVHRLPVVDEHERLVGIISTMDILRVFAETESRVASESHD